MFRDGTGVDDIEVGLLRPGHGFISLLHEIPFVGGSFGIVQLAAESYI